MAVTENVTPLHRPDSLPPMDVAGRIGRLRELLDGAACDAIVVSNLTNVRYLVGFTGSAGQLLVTPERAVFVTDGRYREQSADEIGRAGLADVVDIEVVGAEPDAALAAVVSDAPGLRLGLEADAVTWTSQRRWAEELVPSAELVPTSGVVEGLRLVKDAGEAARIRSACAVADAAFAIVRNRLAEGPTEAEFALELDTTMRSLGASDVSFETIVAAGTNGARPHHRPSDHRIGEGEMVVVDFGALVDGYHSDMTRTVAVGEISPDRQRMLDVVLESQAAGVAALGAGEDGRAVDAACRAVIDDAGWGDAFVHSTGHGVGLDIHEEPRVSARSDAELVAGHVVTVEPGVYLPGLGGVRIEDTLLVTEDGCDRLTLAPKEPALA
jgi:Xaa-Pro aminopeptidase